MCRPTEPLSIVSTRVLDGSEPLRLVAVLSGALDDAVDVRGRPVLAQLGLCLDPADHDLEADDRAELTGEEFDRHAVSWP